MISQFANFPEIQIAQSVLLGRAGVALTLIYTIFKRKARKTIFHWNKSNSIKAE
jgi:hypothetical protein